ncbi:pentapeptide repeat-containing protein [Micromonospora coerulea]|uniref:pentapeptide repeat-containing protein n=1 Tax=Micromonospora coerulea TaxID=47856 RepID=UPI0019077E5A|nr:pentapeptide repeat-containing protein [Micromonospora veneta]
MIAGWTAYDTNRSADIAQDSVALTREQLRIAEATHLTERFTAAVDQLGSEKKEVRITGILQLERILRDNPAEQPTITGVLVNFIREHAAKPNLGSASSPVRDWSRPVPMPASDLQAALTVLARREPLDVARQQTSRDGAPPEAPLDLSGLDLAGADLKHARLRHVDLSRTDLAFADLSQADLTGASLTSTSFNWAMLHDTTIEESDGVGTQFIETRIVGGSFAGTLLHTADFRGAMLHRVDVSGARWPRTSLAWAAISDVDLRTVDLEDASLRGVNARHVTFPGSLTAAEMPCGKLTDTSPQHLGIKQCPEKPPGSPQELWRPGPL